MLNTRKKVARVSVYIFILAGLLICVYLLYQFLLIAGAENQGKRDVCSAVFGKDCSSALLSSVSTQLGLPLAGWGIIYYAALIQMLLMPVLFGNSFKRLSEVFLFFLTLSGLLAAISLVTLMFITPSLFCPLCIAIHIINLFLFFLINFLCQASLAKNLAAIKLGLKSFFSRRLISPEIRWKLFGISGFLFFSLSLYFLIYTLTAPARNQPLFIDSRPILEEYHSQPVQKIPVTADDPAHGSANSRVQLIVFSDFFCPSCRRFSKELSHIIKKGKGTYRVVFKHFPLSTDCNQTLKKNLHPRACEAAVSAIAAWRQGKFWAYHDSLFSIQEENSPDLFETIAAKTGLNMEQFGNDKANDSLKAKVIRDIALARELSVNATPTVYLNGKLVTDMRPGILQFLINQEIKRLGTPGGSAHRSN